MRRHDSARVVTPRVGCKSPRDRSPQSATVRSDTTKNHGAAFRPDIFQLHVNMIGGGRRCKSPPRRCSQHAHHTCIHVYTYVPPAHIRQPAAVSMPFLAPSTNVAYLFLFYARSEEEKKKKKKKNSTPGIRLTDTLDGRTLGIPFDDTKLAAGDVS
ncbi:hypothetical protein ALC57_06315 [Trachymyrmex cornetzi]|uniref:Uncharacterized protein n=1 Tax=Trachymyrmex cornetzi TaxID=471704 RepID=A0A195E985_9HYME|nr:hypothetical protein ALC57_06315 [Trachymyrmex cornetzi]